MEDLSCLRVSERWPVVGTGVGQGSPGSQSNRLGLLSPWEEFCEAVFLLVAPVGFEIPFVLGMETEQRVFITSGVTLFSRFVCCYVSG